MNKVNQLTEKIIGAAIEVHRKLGPGLLESSYELCLEREFCLRNVQFTKQVKIALEYKGIRLDNCYRLDFLVAETIVVEVKAVDVLLPVHQAQLLSYLKLGRWQVGLLINFHVPVLRNGIRRLVLELPE